MTKQTRIFRQGDVWLYEISKDEYLASRIRGVEQKLDPEKGLILAEGEVTGHHHRIPEGAILNPARDSEGLRLLSVLDESVSLVHEEHSTITIPKGYYAVRIQREYDPSVHKQQRYVVD